jgi:hypothetical protein
MPATITLAGLAQGAMIVGTGMSVIGGITGNKTLTKIGMGVGLDGGVGSIANSMRVGSSLASVDKGLLAADGIKSAISAPTKGVDYRGLSPIDASQSVPAHAFNRSSAGLDYKPSSTIDGMSVTGAFDPQLEKTYFQRANETLTKYNTALNIAGGMGQAYMQGEQMDLHRDLLDKRLDFDQQLVDRVKVNNGTVLEGVNPSISTANTGRNTTAYSGILRGA